jgi:hypothetical protein
MIGRREDNQPHAFLKKPAMRTHTAGTGHFVAVITRGFTYNCCKLPPVVVENKYLIGVARTPKKGSWPLLS